MWTIPFLICAALVATSAWRLRRTFRSLQRASAPGDLRAQELSLYDAAYLSGGQTRAAVTALVAMRLDGRLIVSRSGTVTVTDPHPRNAVEAAIIDAAGPTRQRPLRDLARSVRTSEAIRAIGARLDRAGLLHRPVGLHQYRELSASRAFHGWMLVAALVVGVVTVPLTAKTTGSGGVWSLLAFLLLLALGSAAVIRYRDPDTGRSRADGRKWLASVLGGDEAWHPHDVGLDAAIGPRLEPFALGSTDHVPGMEDSEVQTLLSEFAAAATSTNTSAKTSTSTRKTSKSTRRSATAASTATGAAAAGYASGYTPSGPSGCGTSSGHDGGHSSCGGHSCGGCGGGCGGCGG
ncbi:TIGR04222 domain-containing membrane protein [Streptomyces sp. NPDC008001]|uniref:TIGR04222 domain-containing membrane protein n=1 Tax=Streptomyces sp. NPDC008001 TaxID=3364804 RepID=UPI0036E8C189